MVLKNKLCFSFNYVASWMELWDKKYLRLESLLSNNVQMKNKKNYIMKSFSPHLILICYNTSVLLGVFSHVIKLLRDTIFFFSKLKAREGQIKEYSIPQRFYQLTTIFSLIQ